MSGNYWNLQGVTIHELYTSIRARLQHGICIFICLQDTMHAWLRKGHKSQILYVLRAFRLFDI